MPMRIRAMLTSASTPFRLFCRSRGCRARNDHVFDSFEAAAVLFFVDGEIGPVARHRLAARFVGGGDRVVTAAARHVARRSDTHVIACKGQLEVRVANKRLYRL